jgi:geranylgeranyl diphosphate synthase, type II
MLTFKDCQDILNKKLNSLDLPETPSNLYDPLRYVIDLGGKRIRPTLVLMGCNLFSDTVEEAVNPAMAVELFHNFTLMHDDIMDHSDMRRNKPTVHKKWNENIGILSGDAMLIKAYELLAKVTGPCTIEIFQVFNKTALEVCEGQQLDMDFEKKSNVGIADYLHMIELKTAVLLAASLKIGALISGCSKTNADCLFEFGRNVGMAFQLQDDLLDVYGHLDVFGKRPGNDIVSNKKTFLLLTALELAQDDMHNTLTDWIGRKDFDRDEKIEIISGIFNKLKIKEITDSRINLYMDAAIRSLDKVGCNAERKQALHQLVMAMVDRKK